MPKVGYIESQIKKNEHVKVHFMKDKKNVRSEVFLQTNYTSKKMTKNAANVNYLKEKLKKNFPGYDFKVYDGDDNPARGNMLLGTLRDTYLSDDEE